MDHLIYISETYSEKNGPNSSELWDKMRQSDLDKSFLNSLDLEVEDEVHVKKFR